MTEKLDNNLKPIKEYDPKITTFKGGITFFVLLILQAFISTLSENPIADQEALIVAISGAVIIAAKNFIKNYPVFER